MRHSYQNITSPYVNHRFHGIKRLRKISDESLNKMAGVLEQYNVKVGNTIIIIISSKFLAQDNDFPAF